MFALSKLVVPHLQHVFCLASLVYVCSSSAISMGCVPRDFLASSNSSVVSEAKLGFQY